MQPEQSNQFFSLKRATNIMLTVIIMILALTTLPFAHTKNSVIRLKLEDASTGAVLANTDVQVESDNGPERLPTVKNWSGKSDSAGVIAVPADVFLKRTFIKTGDYKAQMKTEVLKASTLVVKLQPREKVRFKLLDGATEKPIA